MINRATLISSFINHRFFLRRIIIDGMRVKCVFCKLATTKNPLGFAVLLPPAFGFPSYFSDACQALHCGTVSFPQLF